MQLYRWPVVVDMSGVVVDVDNERPMGAGLCELCGFDPVESVPGRSEDLFDRVTQLASGLDVHLGWVSIMRTATTSPDSAVKAATA